MELAPLEEGDSNSTPKRRKNICQGRMVGEQVGSNDTLFKKLRVLDMPVTPGRGKGWSEVGMGIRD